jgi:hypothetical protein
LQLLPSHCAWCRGHCCRSAWVLHGVLGALLLWRVGVAAAGVAVCECCMQGVGGAIVTACRCCGCHCRGTWMLHLLLLPARGCCTCCHHSMWVLHLPSSQCVGVAPAIVAARGCCTCHRCAVWGVMGAVVTPHGSYPHHALSLLLLSIEGPGGPLRERRLCTSARRQYLDAKVDVSQEKKRKRREKSYR